VQAERRNQNGAAIAVIAGIVDVLKIEAGVNATPEMHGVIGLEDIFPAVGEAAISQQKAESAESEILLMVS
jgi:repressor of nif and glnA expression